MILWRISNYADLQGTGGLLAPARWHKARQPIVYTSEHPSLAVLEALANSTSEDLPDRFQLLRIDTGSATPIEPILPEAWQVDSQISQSIGDSWLAAATSVLLKVPTVLVPHGWNYLLNPRHPDAAQLKIIQSIHFDLDPRLK
jgi:RES domain-containing protein